ncbi:MAG TPA: hypothetical protein VNO50_03050 [Pyrinomonadaceae bacterium]|nr:hypothetical protein [Pyrinomonadaceae bacterium]
MSEIMVDEEVENILAEIRDRVRSQELNASVNPVEENEKSDRVSLAPRKAVEKSANEVLARIDSYLTVTSRAWDRLPPLVSNRSGNIARIELWVKRQIKRASHWFTWEQVNFNAAAHHALRDTVEALTNYQQALEALRAEHDIQRSQLEETQVSLQTQREELHAERARFKAQEAQRATQVAAQRNEMDARLSEITREMRERIEHLQDEQRVCFKQLSLEATESAVMEDRARRQTEKMIAELRARLDQGKQ